ncbi:MAG: uracil-DNA glycosylase [Candidatus Woesearchaeota archaeon]
MGQAWYNFLLPILSNEETEELSNFLKLERKQYEVYPESENVFRAFKLCPLKNLRVILIGQDPYHTPGLATGLAFGVPRTSKYIPPSLVNIMKEVKRDYYNNQEFNPDWSLESWAVQGVLLLNTALTVRKGEPLSHKKEWSNFIKQTISLINDNFVGLIFLLWGTEAYKYKELINTNVHHILEAGHPSPLNRSNPFIGCSHFTKVNQIICNQNGKEFEIKW